MKKKYIVYGILGLALIGGLLAIPHFINQNAGENPQSQTGGKTVEQMLGMDEEVPPVYYEGKNYYLNPDVDSYLLMGVDLMGETQSSGSYNGGGQSDVMLLLVVDHAQKQYTVLQINRDTMTEVDVLGVRGDIVGTRTEQIAVAHAYGSGLKDSCQNAVRAVSNLLYDAEIDGYASFRMEAIPVLNDMVGGVPVHIEDDFSIDDPTLIKGETITLKGDQALHYIRGRVNVGNGTNEERMVRHRAYMDSFRTQLEARLEQDPQFLIKLYDAAAPYVVTNIGSATMEDIAEQCSQYKSNGIVTMDGESRLGEIYMEHYLNENSAKEMALRLFYTEKNEA